MLHSDWLCWSSSHGQLSQTQCTAHHSGALISCSLWSLCCRCAGVHLQPQRQHGRFQHPEMESRTPPPCDAHRQRSPSRLWVDRALWKKTSQHKYTKARCWVFSYLDLVAFNYLYLLYLSCDFGCITKPLCWGFFFC